MSSADRPFRLITRSDLDGLVSAAMLRDIGAVDSVMFVHPKDVQDGKVLVGRGDMLVNLPYVATAGQVFDYQAPGSRRLPRVGYGNLVMGVGEASVSRVIYDHFGGESRFPGFSQDLLNAADQYGSAGYSLADVLHPRGWTLLGFLTDPRTGLGRFRDFRVSNLQLMMMLVDACRAMDVERILSLPDVAERVRRYHEHEAQAIDQLRRCARVEGDVIVLDMRRESVIYAANRFLVYALYPNCTVSVHVMWGREKANTVLAVGRSIFNTTSTVDVGDLCTRFGGGGHQFAGTCQVSNEVAGQRLEEMLARLGAAQPAVSKKGEALA
ncbi:MAG: exopolyphosphatase [Lautropia sp.]|nr:exopolyphosphatase [Lautropia sp.]